MAFQKYRFDLEDPADEYGVTVLRARRTDGTPVAGVRNCFCGYYGRRTVYVTGTAASLSPIPAAIRVNGKRINGWLGCLDGRWEFHQAATVPSPYRPLAGTF